MIHSKGIKRQRDYLKKRLGKVEAENEMLRRGIDEKAGAWNGIIIGLAEMYGEKTDDGYRFTLPKVDCLAADAKWDVDMTEEDRHVVVTLKEKEHDRS